MSECKQYAQVIVDLSIRAADQLYDYVVPPELSGRVSTGSVVCVPFGNVARVGYVVKLCDESRISNLKPVLSVVEDEPAIERAAIELCYWVAERYCASLPESLRLAIPPGRRRRRAHARPTVGPRTARFVRAAEAARTAAGLSTSTEAGPVTGPSMPAEAGIATPPSTLAAAPKQRCILELLARDGEWPLDELLRASGASHGSLYSLVAKGLAVVVERPLVRRPVELYTESAPPVVPTAGQRLALDEIAAALEHGPQVFLLEGVTGSGKTEVYLGAVAATLAREKSAIVLVPEISLTPQTIARFRARFGDGVAVLHSGLGAGERYDQWMGIASGAYRVVIGARSAVFAPVSDLGVIVIDEEHETSYKQNRSPRYHAREVAIERARLAGATVVLGSATPSIESRWAAETGKFGYLRLDQRVVGPGSLEKGIVGPGSSDKIVAGGLGPEIEVVDMRREIDPLSSLLASRLEECLSAGGKAILLLNRRGFSHFVLCPDCGHVPKCPACAISLTYHRAGHSLKCHYCDFTKPAEAACPGCGGVRVHYPGIGTQRIEQELRVAVPDAHITRLDADTTGRKGSHERALLAFRSHEKAILLGTQMVAKGLDFPDVTLAGVVDADVALNLPDFRAAERTFQLLMQVSGRAGRGAQPGRVVIQTYAPESYAVHACANGDHREFLRRELEDRRELCYPPFCSLIRIVVAGGENEAVGTAARAVAELVESAKLPGVLAVLGPAPAPLTRLRSEWRWHVIVKLESESLGLTVRRFLKDNLGGSRRPGVSYLIDVDPQWVL